VLWAQAHFDDKIPKDSEGRVQTTVNTVVCIKQTPSSADARLDEDTKTLVREGVNLVISSLDRRALLEALRLRDEVGGAVSVITMGPPQAESALVECLALGADNAIHLTDKAFAGADTLATARALAMGLDKLKPDLVMCGMFSIDSETGQVPSEIAEFMSCPQVTSVRKIRQGDTPGTLWVEKETDEGYQNYEVTLPAVVSITELVIAGRRPAPEELEAAKGNPWRPGARRTWVATPRSLERPVPPPGWRRYALLTWSAQAQSYPRKTPRRPLMALRPTSWRTASSLRARIVRRPRPGVPFPRIRTPVALFGSSPSCWMAGCGR
jgi:electron transfer flavoprotein alpha/beta subunit